MILTIILHDQTSFTNGQPNTSKNEFSTFNDCVSQISIIAYPCSHTCNHPPNVPCAEGFINDGYWEITVTTYCNPSSTINAIAPPNNVMDYSSGGGGLSYNKFHLALQLSFNQMGWLDANQWFKYVLFKPYYQLTQDWEVYGIRNEYIAKLEYLMNNTETCQEITNYLEEDNYVESAQKFAEDLIDELAKISIDSYSGKEDLFPFEWWNDDALIEQYLQGQYESWRNISSEEKRLTKSFSTIAYKLYKNKDIAFQKTFRNY